VHVDAAGGRRVVQVERGPIELIVFMVVKPSAAL